MKGRYVTVFVKNHIRKYIMESLGSDTIKLERDSTLMAIIKPYLSLEADEWETDTPPEGFGQLYIELPKLNKELEESTGRVYWCDTLFRDHLQDKGLKKVQNFLSRNFKAAFRSFMDGYTEAQNDSASDEYDEYRIKVKHGVVAFLIQYHIDFDECLVSSLTRDWHRHRLKNEKYRYSPLIH